MTTPDRRATINAATKRSSVAVLVVVSLLLLAPSVGRGVNRTVTALPVSATPPPVVTLPRVEVVDSTVLCNEASHIDDNLLVRQLVRDDQAVRTTPGATAKFSGDSIRLARILQLYIADSLQTAEDLLGAALILQHGPEAEHSLLAHDLAVAAIVKGCGPTAAWLAAASEDRFLVRLQRPQRFGTQSIGSIAIRTDRSAVSVTNMLRRIMNVPPLRPRPKTQTHSVVPQRGSDSVSPSLPDSTPDVSPKPTSQRPASRSTSGKLMDR